MYRLLKTRHLVQLLTAFYSYMFTSNLKQFLRDQPGLDGTYRARGRPGRGHFLCVRYKWVTQKNLSPSQLLSSSFRGKKFWYLQASPLCWQSASRGKFAVFRVQGHGSIEQAPKLCCAQAWEPIWTTRKTSRVCSMSFSVKKKIRKGLSLLGCFYFLFRLKNNP